VAQAVRKALHSRSRPRAIHRGACSVPSFPQRDFLGPSADHGSGVRARRAYIRCDCALGLSAEPVPSENVPKWEVPRCVRGDACPAPQIGLLLAAGGTMTAIIVPGTAVLSLRKGGTK
jgi:hypothetical protein